MNRSLLPYPILRPICPIDALPDLLKNAVLHAVLNKGIPAAIALTDAIAAAAAVVHCGYDCVTPEGDTMPCTINTILCAPTAAGKGRSYRLFLGLFIEATKRRIASMGDENSTKSAEKRPKVPRVETMFGDTSYYALLCALDGTGMNASIQREDSASLLETDLFKKRLDTLTQLWSGDPPLDHLVRGKQLVAADARCCVGIRIQPDIMDDYIRRHGPLSYKLGFWPRSIAGCHDPDRLPFNETYLVRPNAQASAELFLARLCSLTLLINKHNQSGFAGRILVELDTEVKAFMLELGYRIKQWINPYYADIREAAGRAWENTLRLAVVMHVICIGEGKVSRDYVECAWAIVEWSLSQHRLIFIESPRIHATGTTMASAPQTRPIQVVQPQAPKPRRPLQDAQWLLTCLSKLWAPSRSVTVRELNQFAALSQKRLKSALAWLELERMVQLIENGTETYIVPTYPQSGMVGR